MLRLELGRDSHRSGHRRNLPPPSEDDGDQSQDLDVEPDDGDHELVMTCIGTKKL
jgi:hypothetical protein